MEKLIEQLLDLTDRMTSIQRACFELAKNKEWSLLSVRITELRMLNMKYRDVILIIENEIDLD